MNAVRVHLQRQIYIVINDKRYAVAAAQGLDFLRLLQKGRAIQLLFPQLDEGGSALQAFLHHLIQGLLPQPVPVGHSI